jgi:hypothetical protein
MSVDCPRDGGRSQPQRGPLGSYHLPTMGFWPAAPKV